MGLVENADSHFPIRVDVSGQKSFSPDLPLPPTYEPTTTVTPPTLTSPSPPALSKQTEDTSTPQSPDHGNLRSTYSAPNQDLCGKRSAILLISKECHIPYKPMEVANYLKPLALDKDWGKMDSLSRECLLNSSM